MSLMYFLLPYSNKYRQGAWWYSCWCCQVRGPQFNTELARFYTEWECKLYSQWPYQQYLCSNRRGNYSFFSSGQMSFTVSDIWPRCGPYLILLWLSSSSHTQVESLLSSHMVHGPAENLGGMYPNWARRHFLSGKFWTNITWTFSSWMSYNSNHSLTIFFGFFCFVLSWYLGNRAVHLCLFR